MTTSGRGGNEREREREREIDRERDREREKETQSLGGTHDQMEVCLDENGFLRNGQFKCL